MVVATFSCGGVRGDTMHVQCSRQQRVRACRVPFQTNDVINEYIHEYKKENRQNRLD
jgi:hypothetical protein